ncbi:hypothetical protein BH20VER1_BH20VER1_19940 [soil metagenome]
MMTHPRILNFRAARVAMVVAAAVAGAFLLQGCAAFSGKPPLPKRASLERVPKPAATTDYSALVAGAEVLYFPRERVGSSARSDPAARLLDALQQGGVPFAIAWDIIDASQQELLNQLQTLPVEAREPLIAQLELLGTGRAREHARGVLRDPKMAGVTHLAIRLPAMLQARLNSGEPLAPDEQKLLPGGFNLPASGLDFFAERLPVSERANTQAITGSYRAHVARQQFAAEQVVRHFRTVGGGGKLLVFLESADLESEQGVPNFVAQKLSLRQIVLDSGARTRPKLLTGLRGDGGGDLQVVDGAPRSGGH